MVNASGEAEYPPSLWGMANVMSFVLLASSPLRAPHAMCTRVGPDDAARVAEPVAGNESDASPVEFTTERRRCEAEHVDRTASGAAVVVEMAPTAMSMAPSPSRSPSP